MSLIDWIIVFSINAAVIGFAYWSKRYNRSVADFLAANRCGGRYILAVAEAMAFFGAISFVADFEKNYVAAFAQKYWEWLTAPFGILVTISGWVIYRFRQTKALTLGQFLEMRYGRKFRIFAGSLAFLSGVINFGIFPGMGARFFIYYCGLPQSFEVFGFEISTFIFLMLFLLSIATAITIWGGQISVMVTDFVQGLLMLSVILMVVMFFLKDYSLDVVFSTLQQREPGRYLIDPFDTGKQSFNVWYALVLLVGTFYNYMGWQSSQGYNTSAKSPHEAKMSKIIGWFRGVPYFISVLIIAVCAYTAMHNPSYSSVADAVNSELSNIDSAKLQGQMVVPVFLGKTLPIGLLGLFFAVIVSAFISTHDTFLHSWGSILVQDVLIPIRNKPLDPKQHIRWLRFSIIGVAVFIFLWSVFLRFEDHILMYWMVTGAIFLGGSGSVIIGGLYWKRGTTAGAFSAMAIGSVLATSGLIVRMVNPEFPIGSQMIFTISMAASVASYIVISLLGKKTFNLDKMLHRGAYSENVEKESKPLTFWKSIKERLGITKEFTRTDLFVYSIVLGQSVLWFIIGWVIFILYTMGDKWGFELTDDHWFGIWKFEIYLFLAVSFFVLFWFAIGGFKDMKYLFKSLSNIKRDVNDDGWVNADESNEEQEVSNT